MSGVVEKIKAKVDNVLAKHDNNAMGTGTTTGTNYTGSGVTGTSYNPTGNAAVNAGPHNSNLANKVDPRVDSDLDGSRNAGLARTGPGGVNNTYNGTGTGFNNSGAGTARAGGVATTTTGPHNSNLLNKLDPRVDSDRDGSTNAGIAQYGPGGAVNNNTGTAGTGLAGATAVGAGAGVAGAHHHHNHHGHHGHHNTAAGGGLTGNAGGLNSGGMGAGNPASTNIGPHSSNLMNKLDPRVDSDGNGKTNAGMANYGPGGALNNTTGPAPTTAGHHTHDIMNELDPRVNSHATQFPNNQTNRRY